MADTPASAAPTLSAHGVDVVQAESDFNQTEKTLSNYGGHSRQTSSPADPEKGWKDGECEDDQSFNLKEYLASSNDKNQAAGLKHKHIGVTWEDLEVRGFGGGNNKVRSFSDVRHRSYAH